MSGSLAAGGQKVSATHYRCAAGGQGRDATQKHPCRPAAKSWMLPTMLLPSAARGPLLPTAIVPPACVSVSPAIVLPAATETLLPTPGLPAAAM